MNNRNALLNSHGMTLTEVLVASGLIMLVSLGLGSVLQVTQANRGKNETINNALGLESALVTAFSNPESVTGYASGSTLRLEGGFKDQTQLNLNYSSDAQGAATYFKNDFSTCSNFELRDCTMKVDLSVRDFGGGRFGYAYRLSMNPKVAQVAPLGGAINPSTGEELSEFPSNAYVMLPNVTSGTCTGPSCSSGTAMNACDPNRDIAAYGINLQTNQASCLAKPQNCPADTATSRYVARGILVNPGYGTQLDCKELRKTRCPANYALRRINTGSLEGTAPDAECVFAAQENSTYTPNTTYTSGSISGQLCPRGYVSRSTCQLVNVVASNGVCPGGVTVPPLAGVLDFRENGEFVVCRVMVPAQPCGAAWTAQAQLNVGCQLDPSTPRVLPASFQ